MRSTSSSRPRGERRSTATDRFPLFIPAQNRLRPSAVIGQARAVEVAQTGGGGAAPPAGGKGREGVEGPRGAQAAPLKPGAGVTTAARAKDRPRVGQGPGGARPGQGGRVPAVDEAPAVGPGGR